DHDAGEEHVPPLRAAAQQLRKEREYGCAEQGSEHALGSTEQDKKYDGNAERDAEILCFDIAEMMGIEPAADPGEPGAERERGDLKRAHVEAHEVGHAFVVMHCRDGDAKSRGEKQPY